MTLANQTSQKKTSAKQASLVPQHPAAAPNTAVAGQPSCGYQIDRVVEQIDPPAAREIIGTVFQNLLSSIECLYLIERRLRQVDAADETFALFQVIHDEARSLVDFIRVGVLGSPLMSEELNDTLDGITFALTHDLQRVFETNSHFQVSDNTGDVVVGKLYRAHDVLTNCLQQSTITLAMVFDSNLVGAKLFNNSDMRYRQSLQLCQDLSALIQLIDTYESNGVSARSSLAQGIEKFRQQSLEHLMYSDWPQFESFCERIELTPDESPELESALHQFRCYLETLLGQVRMRAVLANVFPVKFGETSPSAATVDIASELGDETTPWNPIALAG